MDLPTVLAPKGVPLEWKVHGTQSRQRGAGSTDGLQPHGAPVHWKIALFDRYPLVFNELERSWKIHHFQWVNQKVVGSFFCICSWLSPLESSGFPPASFVRQSPQGERIPLVTGPIQMLMTGGAMGCLIVVLPPWYDMMQSHTFVYIYIYIFTHTYIHSYLWKYIDVDVPVTYVRPCARTCVLWFLSRSFPVPDLHPGAFIRWTVKTCLGQLAATRISNHGFMRLLWLTLCWWPTLIDALLGSRGRSATHFSGVRRKFHNAMNHSFFFHLTIAEIEA